MKNHSFRTNSYKFINYALINEADSRRIWEIRNNPEVAQWMVNPDPIPLESHFKFIESLKENTLKDYFIIKDIEDNLIGSVNISYSPDGYSERGIFINPTFFHKNHAYRTMTEFYEYAKQNWDIKGITTRVKKNNIASNKLEEKLGASVISVVGSYNHYCLEL